MFKFALPLSLFAAVATPTNRQIGPQTGQATYYPAGFGACGVTNSESDFVAAVSGALFDSFPGYDGNPFDKCIWKPCIRS
ncbi:hypothetical protein AURDEDRAFT_163734 [Auricularia subglabra TFB-10046 SS5]|nr:hypothetical protein AURDEDRAFT_163734 [Auricularia subglabra TFB-10046 SS5]